MDLSRLESQIKQAEGVRLVAYKDSLGLWTAGVGHLLPQNRDWTGVRFSVAQVAAWLEEDLITAQKLSQWAPGVAINGHGRQAECINRAGLQYGAFPLEAVRNGRKAMSEKNWPEASKQLLSSLWAKQVGPIRSNRIAKMILSGDFA
jgi:GH24 family phage-related lysozyme (muramidase)